MAVTANLRHLVARVERPHAVLEALRQRAPRPVTAVELSERLEVSTRTVERDLGVLTAVGVPIQARKGRGGGYSIDTRVNVGPVMFTPGEAAAVVASLVTLGPFATAAAASAIENSSRRCAAEQRSTIGLRTRSTADETDRGRAYGTTAMRDGRPRPNVVAAGPSRR